MQKYYAAIGPDPGEGAEVIVWGIGETRETAFAEGLFEIEGEIDTHLTLVEITAEQAERVCSGEVRAATLGISTPLPRS